ncbi:MULTISPECIES: Bug family tripartite tricarboxylate transporter substrate binding protein [Ramlibacter]|uniref:Tripartite tricarboxylate transporter substrate binding protein n=1 Tax=Ramlibacter pinisoli TaxID=2682844 RepID=A0A6N8IRB9_9BURK|nr:MULTISPECIES: tripartite tricarboxylate transporter substrate binding protein [Ramlibacter]MBA2963824.1 tripartite tricarboxylate transporter substrate binding protein [Ramlibacter sp. CGMCC 1.13660]MVQ28790.1 tripartite tricarboxylate transporter substrate binding protein [Ramlibacter pinisoli]
MNHQLPSRARRRVLATACAAFALAAAPWQAAQAQSTFPGKTITFVVPYPAGGANDMLGRLIGQKMGEALGTTALIDNKPGAGALLGAGIVARAPADGNTLLVGGLATHAASPNLLKADYDPLTAFEPVGMIGRAPIIAITFNESPYKTLKDVVDAARKDSQAVMYGSSGNGSPLHLAGEQFMSVAKIQMTHVPYKGGNAHIMDLIGGRVPVIFDTATNAMPLVKSGKVRALAVGMPSRLPDLPNVPTFAEAGFPQFEFTAWYALFAPAKTPKDVTAKLSAALARSLKQPEVVSKLGDVGVTVADGDAAALARFVPVEYERVGQLIRVAKIKAD